MPIQNASAKDAGRMIRYKTAVNEIIKIITSACLIPRHKAGSTFNISTLHKLKSHGGGSFIAFVMGFMMILRCYLSGCTEEGPSPISPARKTIYL